MEGEAWGFNAIDFESNIEDSMSVAAKTANCTIWISLRESIALDQAISDRLPTKPRKATQWAVSVFRAWCDARGFKDAPEKLRIC